MLYWKQSNLFLLAVIQKKKKHQRDSMDQIIFVLLKHTYFSHPVVLQHQGIGAIHTVTPQYSNQSHPGHITAGNNELHSSNNNRGFHYVVIHTHDELPSQITITTKLTLHHTSRAHYFHHTPTTMYSHTTSHLLYTRFLTNIV
jgi:hypothetical protein